ncbi:unnamed protein product [Caenorhabditis auriculariae]|uniref:DOMON domain-containing protein n=1 Tax=Caenorhabditis auriculariae TaxID=2777116 RepID=A0A8S1HHB4_9PELO|nr:unnamed protein product [Caenorhabditis auriculariae]
MLFAASVIVLFNLAWAQNCNYAAAGVNVNWQTSNGMLTIDFSNGVIQNNEWTAIGFGAKMANLEVIVFKIVNGVPSVSTGFTKGYGPPTLDSNANVGVQTLMYNGNTLTARIVRPLAANGPRNFSLQNCMTWTIVPRGPLTNGNIHKHTTRPEAIPNVCPAQC